MAAGAEGTDAAAGVGEQVDAEAPHDVVVMSVFVAVVRLLVWV